MLHSFIILVYMVQCSSQSVFCNKQHARNVLNTVHTTQWSSGILHYKHKVPCTTRQL